MHVKRQPDLPHWWRRACMVFLALFWCVGLLIGVRVGTQAGDTLFSLMRTAAGSRVSIVGLLVVTVLPFLFSAAAVFFSKPWLMLPVLFFKGLSFGACAYGVCGAFGDAGWLIRLLLLFSDGFMIPVLFWFCLRHMGGQRWAVKKDLAVCATAALIVGSLDYCFISPFLAMLIEI